MKHGLRSTRAELEAGRAVTVYPHRRQVVAFFVLSWLILAIALWLVLIEAPTLSGFERRLYTAIGLGITGFGGWVFVDFLRRLLRHGPAMVIDPAGVSDYTHGRQPIFVPWSEIGDVYVGVFQGGRHGAVHQRFVSIRVRAPGALRERVGPARFALLSVQEAQMGALVNISENLLPDRAKKWVRIIRTLAQERGALDPRNGAAAKPHRRPPAPLE